MLSNSNIPYLMRLYFGAGIYRIVDVSRVRLVRTLAIHFFTAPAFFVGGETMASRKWCSCSARHSLALQKKSASMHNTFYFFFADFLGCVLEFFDSLG